MSANDFCHLFFDSAKLSWLFPPFLVIDGGVRIVIPLILVIGLLSFPGIVLWLSFVQDKENYFHLVLVSMVFCVMGVGFSLLLNSEMFLCAYGLGLLPFLIYAVARMGVIPDTVIVYGKPLRLHLTPNARSWIAGVVAAGILIFVYASLNRYQVISPEKPQWRIRVFDRWTGQVTEKPWITCAHRSVPRCSRWPSSSAATSPVLRRHLPTIALVRKPTALDNDFCRTSHSAIQSEAT